MGARVDTNVQDCRGSLPVMMLALLLAAMMLVSLRYVHAATETATVDANIVSTINIVARNGIVFGDIGASSIPGTVLIIR